MNIFGSRNSAGSCRRGAVEEATACYIKCRICLRPECAETESLRRVCRRLRQPSHSKDCRPRQDQQTSQREEQHAATIPTEQVSRASGAEGAADVANVAEQVIDLVQEPPPCRICLSPECAETGPVHVFGVACTHTLRIMQWALMSGTGCPVCRQPLSIAGVTTTPPTPRRSDTTATIAAAAEFREDMLRDSTVEEQLTILESLGAVDRSATPVGGPGSALMQCQEALVFAVSCLPACGIDPLAYFSRCTPYVMGEVGVMPHYWIEARRHATLLV